jgi:hypothetical protein
MRVHTALALVLIAPAWLAGCGDGTPADGPASTAPGGRQEVFAAADSRVPKGYREELCPDLRGASSGLALRLVVPADYAARTEKSGKGCFFQADLDRDFAVSMGSRHTLRRFQERNVDPFSGDDGDDGTSDVAYEPDVAVYGERRGERLTWPSSNDGLPLDNLALQADGVRLSWHTPRGRSDRWADQLAGVTASLAVVETEQDTCTADGRTATYTVPRPQAAAVEDYDDRCYLYLRPRDSLLRYAEIDPLPRRSAEELASSLPGRKHVVAVALERDAATLMGRSADRLTWVVVRPHRTWDGPRGTWRMEAITTEDLHVTWGATPAQWRHERAAVDAFVASVRLSPARPSRS